MNSLTKISLYIIGIIWYACFYIAVIPSITVIVGKNLDWFFFTYLFNLDIITVLSPSIVLLIQGAGMLAMLSGSFIIILSWLHITQDHSFFPFHIIPHRYAHPEKLISSGLYGYVRHPMALGYIICLTGLGALVISPLTTIWVAPLLGCIGIEFLKHTEEKELYLWFGEEYKKYCDSVPAIIPKLSTQK